VSVILRKLKFVCCGCDLITHIVIIVSLLVAVDVLGSAMCWIAWHRGPVAYVGSELSLR
jgi:hypothetical protein